MSALSVVQKQQVNSTTFPTTSSASVRRKSVTARLDQGAQWVMHGFAHGGRTYKPTYYEAAAAVQVSVRALQNRVRELRGDARNGNGNGANGHSKPGRSRKVSCAASWIGATDAERIDAIRRVGPERVAKLVALAITLSSQN